MPEAIPQLAVYRNNPEMSQPNEFLQIRLAQRLGELTNFRSALANQGKLLQHRMLEEWAAELGEKDLDLKGDREAFVTISEKVRAGMEKFGLTEELVASFQRIESKFSMFISHRAEPLAEQEIATDEELKLAEDYISKAEDLFNYLVEHENIKPEVLRG